MLVRGSGGYPKMRRWIYNETARIVNHNNIMNQETMDEIFKKDLIGDRECIAQRVHSIIEQESCQNNGFVLAINGEWGIGKTTFVEMLSAYLKSEQYRIISFNCWERDFVDDPLIAMFAEMKNALGGNNRKLRKLAGTVTKVLVGASVGAVKGLMGTTATVLTESLKGGVEAASDVGMKLLDDYEKQTRNFDDFKKALKDYVTGKDNDSKPVVFIIDELDRCNPHFAVKVLERIKHLFDVPKIFFILPICKSQLECSIKGFYGSDMIDANNYLRKFIDLEIELPVTNLYNYCRALLEKYNLYASLPNDKNNNYEHPTKVTRILFENTQTDLRTADKILCHVSKVMNGRYGNNGYYPILILSYLKIVNHQLYERIKKREFSIDELLSQIEYAIPRTLKKKGESSAENVTYIESLVASLLCVYNRKPNDKSEYEDISPWQSSLPKKDDSCFDKSKILESYHRFCECDSLINMCISEVTKSIDTLV